LLFWKKGLNIAYSTSINNTERAMQIEIEYEEIKFSCEYEYEAGQTETEIDPPFAAQAFAWKISVVGTNFNLLDVLSLATVEAIEELIVEAHQ
jgi:hypothetical protein